MQVSRSEVERRLAAFVAAARQAGVKLTPQRLEIFAAVACSLEHPDAEAVLRAVQPALPKVSLDTVYRTLATLAELGVLAPLGPRHQSVRFDANLAPHHHFVCLRCGLTRDFESADFDALRVPRSVARLGRVVTTQVEVRGLCAACSRTPGAGSQKNTPRQTPNTRRRS